MTIERTGVGRVVGACLIAVLLVAGCSTAPVADVVAQRSDRISAPTTSEADSVSEPADTLEPSHEPADTPPTTTDVAEILEELEAAGFCDPVDVEDEGLVTAMHFVVEGQLQDPCYADPEGSPDQRLLDAWMALTEITPLELVDDVSLLAGYEACSGCDTLAFVAALDTEASFFLLAVDVVAGAADPDELRLTMMHELTHVFAQEPGSQLNVQSVDDECATYFNGVGCFTDDSYMWAWIEEFWPAEELDGLPADGSPDDDADAEQRCRTDAAYTGSYATVHPEEDFAETFSAYVYDVETDPALGDKLAFFDRYPEFVAIRENARSLGLAGIDANFDGCG